MESPADKNEEGSSQFTSKSQDLTVKPYLFYTKPQGKKNIQPCLKKKLVGQIHCLVPIFQGDSEAGDCQLNRIILSQGYRISLARPQASSRVEAKYHPPKVTSWLFFTNPFEKRCELSKIGNHLPPKYFGGENSKKKSWSCHLHCRFQGLTPPQGLQVSQFHPSIFGYQKTQKS